MSRVLVTGANGHIGSNTVRSLLNRGHEVVPFVRRTSDLRGLDGLGLEYRYGDVRDYDSLSSAVEGCDAVIHHAAVFKSWAKNPDDEIIQPGLIGTRNIIRACAKAGIDRLVYTSSGVAIGACSSPDGIKTEADWPEDSGWAYAVEKVEGEREAARLSAEMGVPTVRILPGAVLGPYDYRITPTTMILLNLLNGTGVTYTGGINYVDVRDVADAHTAALEKGEPGQRYIVGGDNIDYRDLRELIRDITGIKPRHVKSERMMLSIAGLMELAAKAMRTEPFVTKDAAELFVGKYWYCDCSLANSTFGLNPRPAKQVIEDAIRWLLFVGKVKPKVADRLTHRLPPDPDW